MSFDNTDYIYDHLPARFRGADEGLLLKRFLSWYGGTLDDWDAAFDSFHQSISPATAAEPWVVFWMFALFGWSWFPWWFALSDKALLYSHFARHLARRGTRRGIERFLHDFGIVARVHLRALTWGEFVWGEPAFSIDAPLRFIVEIIKIKSFNRDIAAWGEGAYGEAFYTRPRPLFTEREIVDLVRYQQPQAQEVKIVWRTARNDAFNDGTVYWGQISW